MKSYEEFAQEAYTKTYGDIEEGWGSAARWALRGARAVPGLGTVASLGYAGYKLGKGDKTGAALAAGSAIPGPVGYGFLAADIARDIARSQKSGQKAQKPSTPQTSTAAAKPSTPTPSSTKPAPTAAAKPSTPTPPSNKPTSTTVLAKQGGVEGKLDKATKKFTPGKWSDTESSRYSSVKASKQ